MSVPVSVDVVVAGAGIIGCTVAYELAKRGYRVEVFETRHVGGGATHATAGVLAPFIHAPSPEPLQHLAVESFRMYGGFVAEVQSASGIDVEYRHCGTLEIPTSNEGAARLKQLAELARAAGLAPEWRERGASAAHSGNGLLIPEQGYVRVEQLMRALRRAADRHGVLFHQEEPVQRIDPTDREVIVQTSSRRVGCSALVLAAGSWSDQLGIRACRHPSRARTASARWLARDTSASRDLDGRLLHSPVDGWHHAGRRDARGRWL